MNEEAPIPRFSRFTCLDVVMTLACCAFVGALIYRYNTQDYWDWKGVGGLIFGISVYLNYRRRPGDPQPDPYKAENDHPFVTLSMMLLGFALGFLFVWTFAFADGAAEQWRHAQTGLVVLAVAAAIFTFAWKRDRPKREAEALANPPAPLTPETRGSPGILTWGYWCFMLFLILLFAVGGPLGWSTGSDAQPTTQNPYFWAGLGLLIAAAIVRWVLFPMVTATTALLFWMLIGLIFNVSLDVLCIVPTSEPMPRTKLLLYAMALLSTLQFAPIYTGSFMRRQTS